MEKTSFGTHEVAKICQVTPPTVIRWIEEGRLASFRTVGGHRRVPKPNLVAFLRSLDIAVPARLREVEEGDILIVDDEPETRRFISRVVHKHLPRVGVVEAEDGFDAGRKIAASHPFLIILDLRLPGVDGFKVCRTVKTDGDTRDIRILAITGHGVEESRRRVLEAGADAFLAKPFDADELLGALRGLNIFNAGAGDALRRVP